MNVPVLKPMSEAEIEQLAERLAAIKHPDALSLEGMDGLFCALIASPQTVPPSVYLPMIWGGEHGDDDAFASSEDANATVSLVLRYWNTIVADFEREAIHLPFIVEPGIDGITGRAWARGFMRGVRLAPKGWNDLLADKDEGMLVSIPIVAGEVDPAWPKEPLTEEKTRELLGWMTAGAARAYAHFADARRESAASAGDAYFTEEEFGDNDDDFYPETYVRSEPKIGRNEPCPCGSGKKFKKCCGLPAHAVNP